MPRTKEQMIELIKALPDDITIDDIMAELYFKSQVDEGLAQLGCGEGIPCEDVEKRNKSCTLPPEKLSENAFHKVWDNQDDAAYDKL